MGKHKLTYTHLCFLIIYLSLHFVVSNDYVSDHSDDTADTDTKVKGVAVGLGIFINNNTFKLPTSEVVQKKNVSKELAKKYNLLPLQSVINDSRKNGDNTNKPVRNPASDKSYNSDIDAIGTVTVNDQGKDQAKYNDFHIEDDTSSPEDATLVSANRKQESRYINELANNEAEAVTAKGSIETIVFASLPEAYISRDNRSTLAAVDRNNETQNEQHSESHESLPVLHQDKEQLQTQQATDQYLLSTLADLYKLQGQVLQQQHLPHEQEQKEQLLAPTNLLKSHVQLPKQQEQNDDALELQKNEEPQEHPYLPNMIQQQNQHQQVEEPQEQPYLPNMIQQQNQHQQVEEPQELPSLPNMIRQQNQHQQVEEPQELPSLPNMIQQQNQHQQVEEPQELPSLPNMIQQQNQHQQVEEPQELPSLPNMIQQQNQHQQSEEPQELPSLPNQNQHQQSEEPQELPSLPNQNQHQQNEEPQELPFLPNQNQHQQSEEPQELPSLPNLIQQQNQHQQSEEPQELPSLPNLIQQKNQHQQSEEPQELPSLPNLIQQHNQHQQSEEPQELPSLPNLIQQQNQHQQSEEPQELPSLPNLIQQQNQHQQSEEPQELPSLPNLIQQQNQHQQSEEPQELPSLPNQNQHQQNEEPQELPYLPNLIQQQNQHQQSEEPQELPSLPNQNQHQQNEEPQELPYLPNLIQQQNQHQQSEEPQELPSLPNLIQQQNQHQQSEEPQEFPSLPNLIQQQNQQQKSEEPQELSPLTDLLQKQNKPAQSGQQNGEQLPLVKNTLEENKDQALSQPANWQDSPSATDLYDSNNEMEPDYYSNIVTNWRKEKGYKPAELDETISQNFTNVIEQGQILNVGSNVPSYGDTPLGNSDSDFSHIESAKETNWRPAISILDKDNDDGWFEENEEDEEYDGNKENDKEVVETGSLGLTGSDVRDEDYDSSKWTDGDGEQNTDNKNDDQYDSEATNSDIIEDVVDEELARRNRPPTAPTSMVLFYTWMIVAVLIFAVGISMYQSRCKGVRIPGTRSSSSGSDRKRLLDNEFV